MKTHAANAEKVPNNSADKDSNTETIASKKLCWNGKARNTESSVECRNLLSKEDIIPIISTKETKNIEVVAMNATADIKIVEEIVPTYSDYSKVRRMPNQIYIVS